jgi:uncharacterized membrane protein YbhN (UPF0104 family)
LGYRWRVLIERESDLTLYQHLRLYFVASFFNTFTPGQIGGDAYRFVRLKSEGSGTGILLIRLLQERAIGLVSFIVFFLCCFAYVHGTGGLKFAELSKPIYLAAGFLGAGLAAILLARFFVAPLSRLTVAIPHPLAGKISNVLGEILQLAPRGRLGAVFMLSLVGGGLVWTTAVMVVATDIGSPISFAMLGMVAVLVDLIRLIPITIQGIGVREATFAFLFKSIGLSPETGFVIALAAYIALAVATVLIGGVGFVLPKR